MELAVAVTVRTEEYARMLQAVLSVDDEPRPDKIKREIRVAGRRLTFTYVSDDAKLIRTASSGMAELFGMAVAVIGELSPEAMSS